MKQGGLILEAGRVRSKKKTRNHGQNFILWRIQKNTHTNTYRVSSYVAFSTLVAVSYQVSILSCFPQVKCPLQRRNHERHSRLSAVLLSAIKTYCPELSIEYVSLPKIGGVCEISSNDGFFSLLL